MTPKPKAGLLAHYLALYDKSLPQLRRNFEPLLARVQAGLEAEGIEVSAGPICRVRGEFDAAVRPFEAMDADIIVSLHLAYSPSLESVPALTRTKLPLLLLDTTMDHDFGPAVDPERLLYNHGIHGVQDLACMLRRRGRPFEIVAGHVSESNALARAADYARAARAARQLRRTRALRIGPVFEAMGDFAVAEEVLKAALGIEVQKIEPSELGSAVKQVSEQDVDEEIALDAERFDVLAEGPVHRRSVRLGLGVRRCLEAGNFSAVSLNFLAFDDPDGPVDTVPFLEISKAMSRGLGYGGEGDVLTAALVGALLAGFPRTTFTEIFCPDWKGDSLFLSHMGELNPAVAAGRPKLLEKSFPFTRAKAPAFLAAAITPGPAALVNLAPGPDDTFRLIVAPVQVLGDGRHPAMQETIRGWIRPRVPIARFLETFSRLGGTHHSALVLGDHTEAMAAFARFTGIECCLIE